MENLPPEALQDVATYFQALSEPRRLQTLNVLSERERPVADVAQLHLFRTANKTRQAFTLSP
jgi:3-methyladenine DNA glycosylase/8-oxoguanine DNA glycosylase